MTEILLHGRKVSKGKAAGEALVSQEAISFTGTVSPETGIVIDKGHELHGASVAGKILVFPVGKGSSVGSNRLYEMKQNNVAPKGIICVRADPVIALGAIFADIPMMHKLDRDPTRAIKTGDRVVMDADKGTVAVHRTESGRQNTRSGLIHQTGAGLGSQ